jgi:hypothetical protein
MNCVQDVCCDTACTGADQSCIIPGREGTCLPETFAPAPTLTWKGLAAALGGIILIAAAAIRRRIAR